MTLEEPEDSPHANPARSAPGRRAAEEEGHDDGRHVTDVHELGQEEQGEPDRAVLGVVATDELLLGLDEVEGRAVELGLAAAGTR